MKENVGFASRFPRPRPADGPSLPPPSSAAAVSLGGQDRNPAFPLARPARSPRATAPHGDRTGLSSCGTDSERDGKGQRLRSRDPGQQERAPVTPAAAGQGRSWAQRRRTAEATRAGPQPPAPPPRLSRVPPRAHARAPTEAAVPVCPLLATPAGRTASNPGAGAVHAPWSRRVTAGVSHTRPHPGLRSCLENTSYKTLVGQIPRPGVPWQSLRGRTKRCIGDVRQQGRLPCGHEPGGLGRAELPAAHHGLRPASPEPGPPWPRRRGQRSLTSHAGQTPICTPKELTAPCKIVTRTIINQRKREVEARAQQ